jgi:hypothetical protein
VNAFAGSAGQEDASPYTSSQIAAALRSLHEESVAYWNSLSPARFAEPLGNGWSASETVRHLTKSVRAVTVGLRLPRLLLAFRFGISRSPSRDYRTMREAYQARLSRGADAGRFRPSGAAVDGTTPEQAKQIVLSRHARAIDDIVEQSERWPERSLDRYRLPHPLLGKVSVREMLFFTLYHNRHHLEIVRRKANQ